MTSSQFYFTYINAYIIIKILFVEYLWLEKKLSSNQLYVEYVVRNTPLPGIEEVNTKKYGSIIESKFKNLMSDNFTVVTTGTKRNKGQNYFIFKSVIFKVWIIKKMITFST